MRRTSRGWSGLLAGVLAVVLGVAGCADEPEEPADPPAAGTPPAVEFRAEVVRRGQRLHISYRLVNRSGAGLIVLNRVPAYSAVGTLRDDPDAVYVVGRTGTSTVEIGKRAFTAPDTDAKTWAQVPRVGGVVLAAGGSAAEEVAVALPLRRLQPYGDDLGDGVIKLPDPVAAVVFCVGVLPEDRARNITAEPGDPASVTLPHLVSTTEVQHLFCSPPTTL